MCALQLLLGVAVLQRKVSIVAKEENLRKDDEA